MQSTLSRRSLLSKSSLATLSAFGITATAGCIGTEYNAGTVRIQDMGIRTTQGKNTAYLEVKNTTEEQQVVRGKLAIYRETGTQTSEWKRFNQAILGPSKSRIVFVTYENISLDTQKHNYTVRFIPLVENFVTGKEYTETDIGTLIGE